ncbi:MAG: tRNA threonylcarbamoyladenosine dehydratase [Clostridiales bacterium]|nr:MAG: tRNA threonylcarbamoyladenosine dehydratase [Clostridiales bacterium]
MSRTERTEMLIGKEAVQKLSNSSVAVFGTGGVGSYVVEALARAGIGSLTLIDADMVAESNINRQLCALTTTVGKIKVDVMKERVLQINPELKVDALQLFFDEKTAEKIDFSRFSYIVDAIDTVTSKLLIIKLAKDAGVPVISSMGTGNKLDPTKFEVSDIEKTEICPLARVMRRELKKRGIKGVKVVYSKEEPRSPKFVVQTDGRRQTPASISFVPSVAGLILAGEVIKDLVSKSVDPV